MGLEMFQHRRETQADTIQTKVTRRPTMQRSWRTQKKPMESRMAVLGWG